VKARPHTRTTGGLRFPPRYESEIISAIKSRIIRWAGHVARVGKKKIACMVPVETLEAKKSLGILSLDGRKINICYSSLLGWHGLD
jgi:hypothetical protein